MDMIDTYMCVPKCGKSKQIQTIITAHSHHSHRKLGREAGEGEEEEIFEDVDPEEDEAPLWSLEVSRGQDFLVAGDWNMFIFPFSWE